jgi:hypothetical protein
MPPIVAKGDMPRIVGLRCANPTYDLQVNKLQIGINNEKFETERQLTQNLRLFAFICGLKKSFATICGLSCC